MTTSCIVERVLRVETVSSDGRAMYDRDRLGAGMAGPVPFLGLAEGLDAITGRFRIIRGAWFVGAREQILNIAF